MDLSSVTKINFENEVFELGENNIEEVLSMLDINFDNVDMEIEDNTLYILNKTGTKGSDYPDFYNEDNNNNDEFSFDIEQNLKETLEKILNRKSTERVKVDFVDGKLVEKEEENNSDYVSKSDVLSFLAELNEVIENFKTIL